MVITQIAYKIGKPDIGYALIALPSEDTKHKISHVLRESNTALSGNIWVMPLNALHITLCEIIQPKEYGVDKQTLFEQHSEEYMNITLDILAKYRPITITLNIIAASPQAIIIRGADNGSFDKIRAELVNRLPLPTETKMPPDIIHLSIARFIKEIPLDEVDVAIRRLSIAINEEIVEFRLIKNILPPLLDYETIHTYPLSR